MKIINIGILAHVCSGTLIFYESLMEVVFTFVLILSVKLVRKQSRFLRVIQPYTASWITYRRSCTLLTSQAAAIGRPTGLTRKAITNRMMPFCGE